MATIVGDIAIKVGADIGALVTDMQRAQRSVSSFGAVADTVAKGGMKTWTLAGTAMAGAATAAGLGLVALTKASMENIDAVSKAASKLGIHTASLQAMAQVADEAGVSLNSLAGSMAKMQNNIASLRDGTAAQVEAFKRLSLGIDDLQNLGADDQFALIAERIALLQDPTEKTAAAMDIFGKSGTDLMAMFDGYAASLDNVNRYQRQFGIQVSDAMGKKVEAANDAMGRLTGTAAGLGNVLAVALAPVMNEVADAITNLLGALTYAQDHVTENAIAILVGPTGDLTDELSALAGVATQVRAKLAAVGDQVNLDRMFTMVKAINDATEAYQNQEITLDEYRARVEEAAQGMQAVAAAAQIIDGIDLSGAIGEIDSLRKAISITFDAALGLAEKLVKIGGGSGALKITGSATAGAGVGGASVSGTGSVFVPSPSPGGWGGASDAWLQAELQRMQDAFASETDLENQRYADQLAKLEEFRKAKLDVDGGYDALEKKVAQDHQKKLADIQQAEFDTKMQAYSSAMSDLGSLMQTKNKELFEIGKAASIASAIVDGYQSAVSAWKTGMEMGGPWLAAAFTAASLVKTRALISQIASTHIGSTSQSAGGGGGSGVSTLSGGGGVNRVANVTLVGDTFSRQSVEDLFNQINGGLKQGFKINVVN